MTLFLSGIKSEIVENGQEAVDAVANRGERFDVIFMDHTMPIMVSLCLAPSSRIFERNRECGVSQCNASAIAVAVWNSQSPGWMQHFPCCNQAT